jgi:hypothetical protein
VDDVKEWKRFPCFSNFLPLAGKGGKKGGKYDKWVEESHPIVHRRRQSIL